MTNVNSPLDIFSAFNPRVDDWFGRSLLDRLPRDTAQWLPAVDIRQEQGNYCVEMDVPGFKSEDVEVTVEDRVLSIRGNRASEEKSEREGYLRTERRTGAFVRQFLLPAAVQSSDIVASVKDGVLNIQIPQAEAEQPKKITVS